MFSWLSPYRWLLYAALAGALVLGYFAWADHQRNIGYDKRSAEVIKARADEDKRNAAITAKWQKDKDDAYIKAAKQAADNKAAADRLAVVNRGLRDQLASERGNLSSASLASCRQYAATLNAVFGSCTDALGEMAGRSDGHSRDSLMFERSWPK